MQILLTLGMRRLVGVCGVSVSPAILALHTGYEAVYERYQWPRTNEGLKNKKRFSRNNSVQEIWHEIGVKKPICK